MTLLRANGSLWELSLSKLLPLDGFLEVDACMPRCALFRACKFPAKPENYY